MSVNSYTGNSSYAGSNTVTGDNAYTGVSELQGVNQYSGVNAGNPNIAASNITDTGLRDYLVQQNLFKPVNSYQKLGVARLNDLQEAASGYGGSSTGSTGSTSYGPETWLYGDNGYTRRMQDNGYMYDLLNGEEDVGDGYYSVDEALSNVLRRNSANVVRQQQVQNSIQQYVNPTYGTEGAIDREGYWETVANPELASYRNTGMWDTLSPTQSQSTYDPNGTTEVWSTGHGNIPGNPNSGYYHTQQEAVDAWLASQQELITQADTPTEKLELLAQALSGGGLSNVHAGDSRTVPLLNQLGADFAQISQDSGGDLMKLMSSSLPGGGLINRVNAIHNTMDYNHDLYEQVVEPQITTLGDNRSYSLTGNQANIGATPVWSNGRIIGYTNSLNYAPGSFEAEVSESYKSGSGIDKSTNSFNYQGQGANYVTQNDPDWWQNNVYSMGDGRYFIPVDRASSNAGFTSNDIYQAGINDYEKKAGLVSQLGKAATGMVLGAAFGAGGAALGGMGGAAGAAAGQALGGALPGAAMGAANGQDWQSILKNAALSSAGGYLGAQYGGDLGNALGGGADLGKALIKGGISAGGAALRGGGAGEILTSGALGGLGSYGSAMISDLTEGMDPLARQLISAGYGGVLGGVGSNLSGGSFTDGALSSLAGSLGGAAVNSFAPGYGNLGSAFGTALANSRIRKRRKK